MRATDTAGNTGGPASDDYVLDRVAPGAPALTATPGAVGNDPSPTWSFDADPGTSTECRLERGATVVADWQACAGSATYDLSAEPDGLYRFRVRSADDAGNLSPETTSDHELDTTGPAPPSIGPGPGAVGSSRTPSWGFSGEPGAVHECRLTRGPDVIDDWAVCSSPAAYDLAGQSDATYTFLVRGTDASGNTGAPAASDYRLDTVGEDTTIESGPGPVGRNSAPAWAFSGEPGAGFDCLLEGPTGTVADWAACSSPHDFDLTAEPDGAYRFSVRSRDQADNLGPAASYDYELDRAAPGAPDFTSTPGALGNDSTPRWAFAVEPGALAECSLVSGDGAGPWEPCADERIYDLATRGDGRYSLLVRATDPAGNVGPAAESAYRLDTTAPGPPTITDDPGASGRGVRVSWAFSGEPEATFECRLAHQTTVVEGWAPCADRARFDLEPTQTGEHTFRVRARDQAGNLGSSARSDYVLLAPAAPSEPRGDDPAPRDPARTAPTPGAPTSAPRSAPANPSPAGGQADGAVRSNDRPAPGPRRGGRPEDDRDRQGAGAPRGDDNGPRSDPGAASDDDESLAGRLFGALGDAAGWAARNADKTGFPLLLLLIVIGYMAFQNRLDRRDPKLALAPVHADRDLEFRPPPRLGGLPAGSRIP